MRTLMSVFVFILTATISSIFLVVYTALYSGDALWHTATVVAIYCIARISQRIEEVLEE